MEDDDLRALYAAAYPRLVGVLAVAAGSRSEAEDVVQEAFARLLSRWPTVKAYDDPEAWVRAVAFRQLSNRMRKLRNGRAAQQRAFEPQHFVTPDDGASLDLRRALSALSLGQRQVVVLHYLLGLTVEAVARELDISPGTVKSRLSRSRAVLQPLLEEDLRA